MGAITELFSTKGRVHRQAFIFGAIASLVGMAALPGFVRVFAIYQAATAEINATGSFFFWITLAVIFFFISGLSLAAFSLLFIKRQQDRDSNPLWLLLLPGVLITWYLASYNELTLNPDQSLTMIGLFVRATTAIVWFGFLADLCLFRGTPGPNRFGPDPLTAETGALRMLLRSPMPLRQLLLSFKGRINRAPYWIVTIGFWIVIVTFFTLMVTGEFQMLVDGDPATAEPFNLIILMAIIAVSFALLVSFAYAQLTIMAKRLHDRNKSAWWILFYYAALTSPSWVMMLGLLTGSAVLLLLGVLANYIAGIVWLWFFVELGFLKGSQGPNRFGPDPLGAITPDARL